MTAAANRQVRVVVAKAVETFPTASGTVFLLHAGAAGTRQRVNGALVTVQFDDLAEPVDVPVGALRLVDQPQHLHD